LHWTLVVALALTDAANPLVRRDHEGEKLSYFMKAVNEKSCDEIRADGVVKNEGKGFVEEYGFSNFMSDGKAVALSQSTLDGRAGYF